MTDPVHLQGSSGAGFHPDRVETPEPLNKRLPDRCLQCGRFVGRYPVGFYCDTQRAGCDCCSPNPLEEVWENLSTEEADQIRTFGIELAYTGESIIRYWEKEPESVA